MTIKQILEMCPNYDAIVNYFCEESDCCSIEFIDYYRDYVHSIPIELNKLKKFDEVMHKYIKDPKFQKALQDNIIDIDVNVIIEYYDEYMEEHLKRIDNTQWL